MTKAKSAVAAMLLMMCASVAAGAERNAAGAERNAAGSVAPARVDKGPAADRSGTDENAPTSAPQPDASAGAGDLGDPPAATPHTSKLRPSPLTPRPNEFPKQRRELASAHYDQLLSDIAALRSRVAALTTTLFKSKLRVLVEAQGDNDRITAFVVTLDGGVVFTAPSGFALDDERAVYEHAVAPGHHVLGVEVEREDARGRQYKTWQTTRFSLTVPDSSVLEARIALEDDSDMAEDFPEDEEGQYEMRVRLRARVTEP